MRDNDPTPPESVDASAPQGQALTRRSLLAELFEAGKDDGSGWRDGGLSGGGFRSLGLRDGGGRDLAGGVDTDAGAEGDAVRRGATGDGDVHLDEEVRDLPGEAVLARLNAEG